MKKSSLTPWLQWVPLPLPWLKQRWTLSQIPNTRLMTSGFTWVPNQKSRSSPLHHRCLGPQSSTHLPPPCAIELTGRYNILDEQDFPPQPSPVSAVWGVSAGYLASTPGYPRSTSPEGELCPQFWCFYRRHPFGPDELHLNKAGMQVLSTNLTYGVHHTWPSVSRRFPNCQPVISDQSVKDWCPPGPSLDCPSSCFSKSLDFTGFGPYADVLNFEVEISNREFFALLTRSAVFF